MISDADLEAATHGDKPDISCTPGPLAGVRILEFEGLGPAPYCAMLLADLGAEVVQVRRKANQRIANPILDRGRAAVEIDIRSEAGRSLCLAAAQHADVLIEGFRPGVMERAQLGPEDVRAVNPALIYGRMTGWGQTGPLAHAAGHDINYVAIAGALSAFGTDGSPPTPPLNLVGDYGGGALFLAMGILAALVERQRSGRGQTVDAAIVDGVSSLLAPLLGLVANGSLTLERRESLLGGAAAHYRCYSCSDGRYIAIGPIEPDFYQQLLSLSGAPSDLLMGQDKAERWPDQSAILARLFATRTSRQWCEMLEGTDACFAPVLSPNEASRHPQLSARETYIEHDGILQPAPAPRLSRTPGAIRSETKGGRELIERWCTTARSAQPVAGRSNPDGIAP